MSVLASSMYISERINKTPVCPLTCISTMVNKAKYILRYKQIHKEKTGIELTDQEAFDLLENLSTLVKAVYQPIPK